MTELLAADQGPMLMRSILPLGVINYKMLRELERLDESGQNVVELLSDWRLEAPGRPLDHYLMDRGLPLQHPIDEWDLSHTLLDSVVTTVARGAGQASEMDPPKEAS